MAHIGRLVPWKGQKEFLQAFARVARQLPGIRALIVGDDIEKLNGAYVEELHSLIRQEGLSERVFCTGNIKDIHNLVAAVDIVVHSSTEPEPFGLVVTEAMALAKPVVAANHGATAEIVEHGRTGLLADPRNTQELAAAIARLATDRSLRLAYGQAALEKATARVLAGTLSFPAGSHLRRYRRMRILHVKPTLHSGRCRDNFRRTMQALQHRRRYRFCSTARTSLTTGAITPQRDRTRESQLQAVFQFPQAATRQRSIPGAPAGAPARRAMCRSISPEIRSS